MHKVVITTGHDPLEVNRSLARENQDILRSHGVRAFDVLGSIGSGKTSLILRMTERLRERGISVGAIAGDVSGDDDYRRLSGIGIPAVNVNTGKECHLDAHYVHHAIESFPLDDIDVLFIENVGNLVCPADFPVGAEKRLVVVSITEGDDMVRKHPMIFVVSDFAVLNKMDLAPHLDASPDRILADYRKIRPDGTMVMTSCRTGQGIDDLLNVLGI